MKKKIKKCATFYIEPKLLAALKKLASKNERSVSSLLCILIARALQEDKESTKKNTYEVDSFNG